MLGLYRPSDNPQPECWMYNPKREAWHRQDFSFLPTLGAEVLASDGGLVCCQTESNLYVCNPLISCWTQIVPANAFNLYSDSVALTVNPKTKAYKVVIIGLQPEIDTYEVHVFDSTTGDWERGARAPCGFKVTDPVITNGHLFCVTINWDIVAYNLDRKEWSRIEVPDDMRPSLMAHNDRLLMGNVFISDDGGLFSHVIVFDVELPTRQVRQVGEMPEDLLQEIKQRPGRPRQLWRRVPRRKHDHHPARYQQAAVAHVPCAPWDVAVVAGVPRRRLLRHDRALLLLQAYIGLHIVM